MRHEVVRYVLATSSGRDLSIRPYGAGSLAFSFRDVRFEFLRPVEILVHLLSDQDSELVVLLICRPNVSSASLYVMTTRPRQSMERTARVTGVEEEVGGVHLSAIIK